MIEIKQITNIKPEAWYNEYCVYPSQDDLDNDIIDCKKRDRLIDIFHIIHNHLAPFNQQYCETITRMRTFNRNSNEFKEAKEQLSEAFNQYYSNIPKGITEKEFNSYHQLIRGKWGCYNEKEIILNYNTLELNAEYLDFLLARHYNIKIGQTYKQLCSGSCKEYHKFLENRIKLCKQALTNGYLITEQLNDFDVDIGECHYCFETIKEKRSHSQTLSDVMFRGFSYTDDQIYDLIRKNEKWHDIERDITIFQEKQKGKYLQELADKYGVKFNTISMVLTKVQGSINYYKGKLFEDFIKKKLKQSGLFKKVIKEAGKGEADILAYHKDGKNLTIYSLKNIKIDRKPYWLSKEELNPELARAKLQAKDYKVNLILLVFDNHTSQIKQFKIDYRNPVDIDISK